MSFTEWSNKKKQEEKNAISGSSDFGNSTKVGTSAKGSFTYWSNRRRIESASSLKDWADTSSSFIKDMQERSKSWYDEKEYKSRFDNFSSLLAQADNWRKQYWGNQDAISYIDSVVSAITDSKNFLTSSRKYYSQWKTEDDYKSFLNKQKEYEDKKNLDLDAYSRETSELEKKLKNYSPDFDWTDATQRKQYDSGLKELEDEISRRREYLSQAQRIQDYEEKMHLDIDAYSRDISALEQQLENYIPESDWTDASQRKQSEEYDAGYKELKDEINRRKQYLTQAQRIQKKDALSSVADKNSSQYDRDFNRKSGYVSTELDGKLRRMSSQYGMGYADLTYEYINNKNGIRKKILDNARASSAHETPFERNGYDYMTKDEVRLYNYYYATGGKTSAEEYLNSIQDDLNQRKADAIYLPLQGKTFSELAFGIGAGVDQVQSGMESAFRGIVGDESYVAPSAKQYASSMVREDLADNGWKLPSWLGGASFGQVVYDAITTTSNMLPSIVVGLANPSIGAAALGLSAGGSAYQEALNEGFSVNQARGYGILSGASEVIMEKLLGGISAYGGNKLGKYFAQNMRNADKALKRVAKEIGGSVLSEFSEEYLQEVLTPVFRNLTLGTDDEVKLISADALYAGFLGGITGGIFEAPNAFYKAFKKSSTDGNATADNVEAVAGESLAVDDKMSATESTVTKSSGKNESSSVNVGVSKMETVQQTADIDSFAQQFGTQANAVRRNYMDGQNLHEYELGFEAAYTMGRDGGKAEALNNGSLPGLEYLSQSQREIAFSLGRDAAAAQNSIENETAQVETYNATSLTNPASSSDANAVSEGKLTSKNNKEQRAASEFTEDGKTVLINTGEEVTVKEIASKKDGQFQLRLEDGRTVDADNVSFGSQDLAVVYDAMAQMDINPSAADILVKNYNQDGELSGAEYAQQVKNAYRFGQYRFPEIELSRSDMTNRLSEHQRNQAYKLGKVFGETTAQQKETDIRQKQASAKSQKSSETVAKKASVGKTEAVGKVHFDRKGRTFSDAQETGLKTMEQLSRLLGVEFHVFESYEKDGKRVYLDENGVEKSAPNGKYDTRTGHIYIDLNAGINAEGTILFTVSHELTHFIRQWSPVKFNTLAEAVFKMAYEKKNINVSELVREQQAKALRNNRDISFDEAYEELVADSMESILTSGKVLEFMAEVKQQDKSLWQKIKEWFKDLADDIRKMVKAYEGYKPDSPEGRAIASMEGILPILEGFYEDALLDAAENYQAAEGQKNASSDSGNKYSFAGRNAVTSDLSALQQAEKLSEQGVDNETIRQQTGWFKGMDGKWRFEIDDSKMEISENIYNYMRLGELMQHEKLYAAYPDIADIDVVFHSLDSGVNGSYNPQFDSINLSYKLKKDTIALKDTLAHELQHAIQQRESFTKGATAESWERKKKSGFDSRRASDIRKAKETERELGRIEEEEPEFYRDMVELDAMAPDLPRGEIDWDTLEKIEDDPVEWQRYDARREELEAKYGDTKVWDMNNLLYQREQAAKNVGRNGVELYFDTAGEIEARDVSNRRSKSIEQRKSSPPRLGNEDTVFAEGNAPADDYIPGDVSESELEIGINEVSEMAPISAISGTEFTTEGRTLLDDVERFFKSVGSQAYNSRLGDVKLTRRGVKDSLAHGMTPQKAAAFAAIPDVISGGKVVGFEKNWKQRGYDSATIAAPITIDGEQYLMAVVVHRSNSANRFYVHDVFTVKKEATPFMTGTKNIGEPGGATSTISIIKKILDVKVKDSDSGNKYSDRDPLQEKAIQALRKENDKLREDVSNLKEMVKLQKKVTGGKMMKPSSVEAAARVLKKSADATGDTKELAKLLGDFYSYIANGEELTWEVVKEAAKPAADWLWNNRKHTIDEYSAEILKELRTRGISFSEDQKSEAAMTHDTFANYRKALFGSVKITNDGMPLDEAWHELSGMYPDVFSEDTNSSDMPRELVDIVDRLRSSDGTYIGYDEIMARHSLIRDIYDSYWNVSTLYTFADAKQKEITLLKIKHKNKMDEVRSDHREEVQQLRTDKQNSVKAVRERHKKSELRRKIRKTVSELNKLLIHGNKKKNIKEGMKDFAATALASAEILFSDNISNEDMLLNGIGTQVDAKENRLIEETLALLQKRKDLYNLDAASQELEDVVFTGESDSYALRMEESKKLDRKISENMRELKSVFERERKRLNQATVSGFLENLAEAYKGLGNSDALYIRSATDERVYQHLMQLKDKIGGATVRDMTVEQLKEVSDAYTMVLTTIRNANKAFTDGRSIQADAEQMASEFKSRKIPDKKLGIAAKRLLDSVGWNYEKLHYALDRIDSPTLSKLFGKLADSENITMRDVQEAKAYQLEMVEKYHYNDWKINQKMDHDFVDNTGKEFRLTLGELMALYAYSRREGADRHIEYGGFTFGDTALTDPNPASTYKLTAAQLKKITGMLTHEQRAFAEAMQKYLSETMGDKGNEVSMKLYGIKLFGEEIYFPLHIAGEFKAQAQESQAKAAAGFQSMSNAGFTQARNKDSTAPIVLEDFMTVWADHVNEMSRYHGAVPALEDIRRVMNYSVYNDSANESMSVEAAMTNAFGKQAVRYFDNLYREANSGAITDRLDAPQKKMLSLFRKNAVAYSLSVIIQQPASIYRARMEVDRKYFGRHGFFTLTGAGLRIFNRKKWNESYSEMMKYAPGVSMAKEIGGFDTSTGSSIRSYLLDTGKGFVQSMKNDTLKYKAKSVMDLVDNNPVANLPNVMDKVAWIEMWEACKRETVAKNPNMRPGSEAFLQKVGQRFTEVIRATQVYDSMFSKSPMLKTKNLFVQSAVSFMNEPNTVANMAEAAIRDMTRGNWKKAGKTGAALVTSIVATNLLKSLVYAIRDDDEDETLLEKYVSAVAGSLIDDVTVFNYIPFARDVWSVVQGYDVERADMAIVSDAVNAVRRLAKMSDKDTASMTEEELEAWDREVTDCQWAVVETLSPLFRIPLKNIRRDILAVFNAVKIIGLDKGRESTVLSIQHAVEDSIWKGSKSAGDRLYEALVSGDSEYAKRLRDNYKNDNAYHTAVRNSLRDHDSRIWEAAVAWNSNDMDTYFHIAKEIKGEKHFIQDDIVLAIRAEANSMAEKNQSSSGKVNGYFTNEKLGAAMGQNNVSMADTIRKDLIDTAVANGKSREDAEESVHSTARTQLKELYANGSITGANTEKMLVKYGGMETEEAKSRTKAWGWMNQNPNSEATVEQVEAYQRPLEGLDRSVADMGIGMDIYLNEKKAVDSFTSDKDENGKTIAYSRINKAFPYINRLNLTREQKTALAVAFGWSYKTVMENKLW